MKGHFDGVERRLLILHQDGCKRGVIGPIEFDDRVAQPKIFCVYAGLDTFIQETGCVELDGVGPGAAWQKGGQNGGINAATEQYAGGGGQAFGHNPTQVVLNFSHGSHGYLALRRNIGVGRFDTGNPFGVRVHQITESQERTQAIRIDHFGHGRDSG